MNNITLSIEYLKINPWIPAGSMFWYFSERPAGGIQRPHRSYMNIDSMWARNSRQRRTPPARFYTSRCGYRNGEWCVTFAYCKVQR